MTRARDMADIVSGNFSIPSGSLGNVQAFPTNWTADLSGSDMVFKYSGTAKFKLTTAGALVVIDDITGYGSV